MGGVGGVRALSPGGITPGPLCAMAELMRHRGPDESSVWVGPDVGLVHTRLGVVDVDNARQPMHSVDGRWVIALAGEVLNHAALRAALDYPFRTHGDTEVVLAGLSIHGISFVERLQGQFAFVAHDLLSGTTHLVRDRLGVVPLYVRHVPLGIAFASEVKALVPVGPPLAVDTRSLDHYLATRSVPAPDTMCDGVKKVRPAHRLAIMPGGHLEEHRYWAPPETDPDGLWSDSDATEAVRDGVREAVRSALVADVPVGAYLSGGLDSSLVVAQAQQLRGDEPLHTFSADFGDDDGVVGQRARRVGHLLGTEHHEVHLPASDFEDLWGRLTWHLDAPIPEPEDVVAYGLARAAADHVRVVLSGDGGDELFAGHARHRYARLAEHCTVVPERLRSRLAGPLERRLVHHPGARTALRAVTSGALDDAWPAAFSAGERQRLLGSGPPTERRESLAQGADPLDRVLRHDLHHHLADHLLERDDRFSMAASVELRPALLDHRLVELACRLPASVKVRSGVTKWVLREAARPLLPEEVIDQRHASPRIPLDSWFRAGLRGTARDRLTGTGSWVGQTLDPTTVRQLVDRHEGGAREEARLWTLLCLEMWHECFFAAPPAVPRPRAGSVRMSVAGGDARA